MAFYNEIKPEHKPLMPKYLQLWQNIAFSTDRIDREKATESVKAAYKLLELPTPEICFFDSLYAAAKVAKPLYERSYYPDDGFPYATKLIAKLHEKFDINNVNAIGHYDGYVESQLQVNKNFEVDRQLTESLRNYLFEGKTDVFSARCNYWFLPLNLYANKGGFFDFHFSVANYTLFQPYDEEAWQVFQQLVKSCGWIIPFDKICLVCDRPTKFLFDSENLLHGEGEASIQFADGNGLYSYHGVTIPEKYGKLNYIQWQPQWLLEETDAELKQTLVQAITANYSQDKNKYFGQALEIAARLGRLNIVQHILATEKDNVLFLDNALIHGVWSKDIQIIQALIDAGANPNSHTEWRTPLIAAASTGEVSIVRYLVEVGADPNKWIDDDGYISPLSEAVSEGHQEICDYLLPFITNPEDIEYAQTELPYSIIRKQRREDQQLQKFFDAFRESDTATVRELVKQGMDIYSLNEDNDTVLDYAVGSGNIKMIKLLAELGADINLPNESGRTPLISSIGIYARQARTLRTLIRAGADVNYKDSQGYTALSYCVLSNRIPPVFEKILLKAGAQYGDWNGTEIYTAAETGNVRLINLLLSFGLDINKPDPEDGLTALMKAVQNSQAWAMRTLIRAGANVNIRNHDGETALYFADYARRQHPVFNKILLKAGATY